MTLMDDDTAIRKENNVVDYIDSLSEILIYLW